MRLQWSCLVIGCLILSACLSSDMGDLSRNFSAHEFECRCGCGEGTPSPELVKALQELRDLAHGPVVIHSAVRCESHNSFVGGTKDSQHLTGHGADISVKGMKLFDLLLLAHEVEAFENGGISISDQHIHVDIRKDGPWRGDYTTN